MQEIAVSVARRLLPVVGFVGGITAAFFAFGLVAGGVREAGSAVARFV
jgi:hypothetical protein